MTEEKSKHKKLHTYFSVEERKAALEAVNLTPEVMASFLDIFGIEAGGVVRQRTDAQGAFYEALHDQFHESLGPYLHAMINSEEILKMMAEATLTIGHAGFSKDPTRQRTRFDELGAERMPVAIKAILMQMQRYV